jgi:hypothetical protein
MLSKSYLTVLLGQIAATTTGCGATDSSPETVGVTAAPLTAAALRDAGQVSGFGTGLAQPTGVSTVATAMATGSAMVAVPTSPSLGSELARMAAHANSIGVVTIESIKNVPSQTYPFVGRRYSFTGLQTIRGGTLPDHIDVPGGALADGSTIDFSDVPRFDNGQQLLAFFWPTPDGQELAFAASMPNSSRVVIGGATYSMDAVAAAIGGVTITPVAP